MKFFISFTLSFEVHQFSYVSIATMSAQLHFLLHIGFVIIQIPGHSHVTCVPSPSIQKTHWRGTGSSTARIVGMNAETVASFSRGLLL